HQSGRPAGGAALAVPSPHQRHGDPYLRPDRLLSRGVRNHRPGVRGHLSPAVATGRTVDVRPVRSRTDLNSFIDLPYRLHARDPIWVPPLRRDVRVLLSPGKNPFFEHADAEYFLAEAGGKVVGRVAA